MENDSLVTTQHENVRFPKIQTNGSLKKGAITSTESND